MAASLDTEPKRGGFRRIVVCVDASETARCVATFARRLAGPDTEFTIAAVSHDPHLLASHAALSGVDLDVAHRELLDDAGRAIAGLSGALADTAAAVRTRVIDLTKEPGDAAQALAQVAQEERADLMIFGVRQHHGLVSWFDPSVTARLSQFAACAMIVVPAAYASTHDTQVRRILFAVDGSSTSLAALHIGAMFATADTQMRVVYVVDRAIHPNGSVPMTLLEDAFAREGELAIAAAVEQLQSLSNVDGSRISAELIRTEIRADDVASALLREAERSNADLMVMGTHGMRWIIRTYFGSVPNRVASLVKIPLMQICEKQSERDSRDG